MHTLLALALAAGPAQFVVIAEDVWLHERPDASAPKHRVPASTVDGSPAPPEYRSWRFLSETKEGWTQIEADDRMLTYPQRGAHQFHCVRPTSAFPGVGVRLWVRSDELQTVVARKQGLTFDDGSKLTVLPGVLASAERIEGEGWSVPVKLPDGVLAKRYVPAGALFPVKAADDKLTPGVGITLDGKPVEPGRLGDYGIAAREGPREAPLLTLRDWCIELKVKSVGPQSQLHADGGTTGMGGAIYGKMGSEKPEAIWVARKGAPATFADGTVAGATRDEVTLARVDPPPVLAPKTCVCVSLQPVSAGTRTEADSPVPLCFQPGDVKKKSRKPPVNPLADRAKELVGTACPDAGR